MNTLVMLVATTFVPGADWVPGNETPSASLPSYGSAPYSSTEPARARWFQGNRPGLFARLRSRFGRSSQASDGMPAGAVTTYPTTTSRLSPISSPSSGPISAPVISTAPIGSASAPASSTSSTSSVAPAQRMPTGEPPQ